MSSAAKPLHDAVKSLGWLIGSWKTLDGFGHYPTIKDFQYCERLEFTHVGQPNINFSFFAFDASGSVPKHREVGFLRVQPGTNRVAYISAHNTGLADMEEGEVNGQELKLSTTNLARMSFGSPPAVQQITRCFRREGDELVQIVSMATSNTASTEHLTARYKLQS